MAGIFAVWCAGFCGVARGQGGPPFYTNDPGTPGNKQWEINLGYMPFLFSGSSITHTPDVDINFGLGDRIQLTFENAYLRVWDPAAGTRYGLGQDQLGFKWRFYDSEEKGFAVSVFPQVSLNNPDSSVDRGITPRGASFDSAGGIFEEIRAGELELGGGVQLRSFGPGRIHRGGGGRA